MAGRMDMDMDMAVDMPVPAVLACLLLLQDLFRYVFLSSASTLTEAFHML